MPSVHSALAFLLDHMPQGLHLVAASRDDPLLPLARLRARGQLAEIRAGDLRFTLSETAKFLREVMGLDLSEADIAALECRTEGWIVGLQLAAASMQSQGDVSAFVRTFTGSHRYILDYLMEEVLAQQTEDVRAFLLQTSVLDRANLFIVALDDERHWYRYHHLFGELLRQRLHRKLGSTSVDTEDLLAELHVRASTWSEDNGLEIDAFHYAAASHDIGRAARLIEGRGMPLTFRGVISPVLRWLKSLPTTDLDANPLLWVTWASAGLARGQAADVEPRLRSAEAALHGIEQDEQTRDVLGRIAATRATLAWGLNDAETIVVQSQRALEYLHPDNLPFRTSTPRSGSWPMPMGFREIGPPPSRPTMKPFPCARSLETRSSTSWR